MSKKGATIKKFYNAVHDDLLIGMISLIILAVVDLIGINAFFLSISVDTLTCIQFLALGFVAVFFKVRARAKGQNVAWLVWTLLTFFGGFMFMLNTVIIQGDDTKPEYVIRAETDYTAANDKLNDLIADQKTYREKNQRTLALSMESSIDAARTAVNDARTAATNAETQWKAEPKREIRALDIFARIPYLFNHPSPALFIASLFFIILYGSVEASIFTIAGEIGKPQEPKPAKEKKALEPFPAHQDYIEPSPAPIVEDVPSFVEPSDYVERFDDVTEAEYRKAAEYPDGSVDTPDKIARALRISQEESERIHGRLYAGYIFRNDKYVKMGE